jgi:hypothetical protein
MTPADIEKSIKRSLSDAEIAAISRLRGQLPKIGGSKREACGGRARKLGWLSSGSR